MTLILVVVAVCLLAFVFTPSRARAPSSRHEIVEGRARISDSEPSGSFDPDLGESEQATVAAHQGPTPAINQPFLPPEAQRPELKTLAEVAEHYGEALKGLGWIVELDRDKFRETLGCYRPKKRGGGRLKHPTVKLSHTPRTIDAVETADGRIENVDVGPRQRLWSVHGPDERGRTWDSLERALPVFLKEAGVESDA
jgi:hypothetical protein